MIAINVYIERDKNSNQKKMCSEKNVIKKSFSSNLMFK